MVQKLEHENDYVKDDKDVIAINPQIIQTNFQSSNKYKFINKKSMNVH